MNKPDCNNENKYIHKFTLMYIIMFIKSTNNIKSYENYFITNKIYKNRLIGIIYNYVLKKPLYKI